MLMLTFTIAICRGFKSPRSINVQQCELGSDNISSNGSMPVFFDDPTIAMMAKGRRRICAETVVKVEKLMYWMGMN